jgi:hypothetical protein
VTLKERFWSKVDKHGPIHPVLGTRCWLWTGPPGVSEYGMFKLYNRSHMAHRVSWFLERGTWPEPCALHKCDVRLCVRFSHLFEGTKGDNNRDRASKNRGNSSKGENSSNAKLTSKQVRQIRKLCASGILQRIVGDKFGVHQITISNIITRKNWGHLL